MSAQVESEHAHEPLPLPTIRRYPDYLRAVRALIAQGETRVSSVVLAEKLGLDPVLTRKDLAMSGVTGRPRVGYSATELADALARTLGWDNATDAVLVGAGSLGRALLGYGGFREHNISLVAAFDIAPEVVSTEMHGVRILPLESLPVVVHRLKVKLGILTVPAAAAQGCADKLVEAGIRGIWNFTAVKLAVPEGLQVVDVDLAQSLAGLSHLVARA